MMLGGDDEEAISPTEPTTSQPTDQPTGEPTSDPSGEPTGEPTSEPTDQPSDDPLEPSDPSEPIADKGTDKGIDAGHGVYVAPAPGYIRKSGGDVPKGVYLVKQGEGIFWLQVVVRPAGESQAGLLPQIMAAEKDGKGITNFKTGQLKTETPPAGRDTDVTKATSQTYTADLTGQNGTTKLAGYVAVMENEKGIVSVIRFVGRYDRAATLKTDLQNMLASVAQSQ
jgi:hypothetical protein